MVTPYWAGCGPSPLPMQFDGLDGTGPDRDWLARTEEWGGRGLVEQVDRERQILIHGKPPGAGRMVRGFVCRGARQYPPRM